MGLGIVSGALNRLELLLIWQLSLFAPISLLERQKRFFPLKTIYLQLVKNIPPFVSKSSNLTILAKSEKHLILGTSHSSFTFER